MSGNPIRVLVAENHPLYRDAVSEVILQAEDLALVASVPNGREALAAAREHRPDVAVLDMRMPELDGMQVLHAIVNDGLQTRVLFLSAHVDGPTVYAAIGAGAGAYLSKDTPTGELCEAIRQVARGGTVLPQDLQEGIAAEIRQRVAEGHPRLTPRENEILGMAAEGFSAPEMAGRLSLSQGTVKTHLQSLYQKLGVSDRAAAVAEAMRRGLLQ